MGIKIIHQKHNSIFLFHQNRESEIQKWAYVIQRAAILVLTETVISQLRLGNINPYRLFN